MTNKDFDSTILVDDSGTLAYASKIEPVEPESIEPPERPMVDFSGSSRATARHYACEIADEISRRAVKPEFVDLLYSAGYGGKVEAYALSEVLLAAMRAGLKMSKGRSNFGTKVAYLGYITHGVLTNHADSLPAYAEGERSRKIAELRSELAETQASLEQTYEAVESATETIEEQTKRVLSLQSELESVRRMAQVDKDAITFISAHLDETQKARLSGFLDGRTWHGA